MNGIHYRTYNTNEIETFISCGFKCRYEFKPDNNFDTLYYLDLIDLNIPSNQYYTVVGSSLKNKEVQRIIEDKRNDDKSSSCPEIIESFEIMAFDDEALIGGVLGDVCDNTIHVDLLAVRKEYRGMKIGTHLMNLVEEKAKSFGISTIDLSTGEFEAREFYEKLGYEIVYARQNYPKGFENYKMIKKL